MGLTIEVGYFRAYPEEAEDEDTPDVLEAVNDLLVSNGLPPHREPRDLPAMTSRASVDGFPYSYLHYLRRVAARLMDDPSWVPSPCGPDGPDDEDELVIERQADRMSNHLLSHSDAEGFYVPVDFPTILADDEGRVPGLALGSTPQLSRDLEAIAPLLGICLDGGRLPDDQVHGLDYELLGENDDPYLIEKTVWFALYEACRLGTQHQAIIIFC